MPRIFLYDQYPVPFCKLAFERIEELWGRALRAVRDCACKHPGGCPACIQAASHRGEGNKSAALMVLEGLLWDGSVGE